MESKVDGVKISVKKGGKREKVSKKTVKKNATKRTPAKRAQASAKEASKAVSNKKIVKKKKAKGGFFSTFIVVIITAIVVGGIIYAWQEKSGKSTVDQVREEARGTRKEFEQRLENLKNKLTGVQDENQELKLDTEKLQEKAQLLEGALKKQTIPELGLTVEYPAIFGDVSVKTISGSTGSKLLGSFAKNDKFFFTAITEDFSPAASNTEDVIEVSEANGYYQRSGKYYYQPAGKNRSRDYEIKPIEVIKFNGGKALLFDKNSIVANSEDLPAINIKENLGAIINLDAGPIKGVVFIDKDFGLLSADDFKLLLSSLEVK